MTNKPPASSGRSRRTSRQEPQAPAAQEPAATTPAEPAATTPAEPAAAAPEPAAAPQPPPAAPAEQAPAAAGEPAPAAAAPAAAAPAPAGAAPAPAGAGPAPQPATLTGYYTQAKADADAAVTSLQATVATANANLAAAQKALNDANQTLVNDQTTNAQLRTQLSQATLASDATKLVADLQANQIATWKDQAALSAAVDATAAATQAQQEAAASLAAAQQAQQQATADLASSKANDTQVAQSIVLVNSAASTAITAVKLASVQASVDAAAKALGGIIGDGMLVLFEQRSDDFQAAQKALADNVIAAVNAQTELLNAKEPFAGAVFQAEAGYDADVKQLNDLAANAASDINSALAALDNAKAVTALPQAEQQALNDATAAARAQIPAEKAVFDAKAQLTTDQANLDVTTLTAYQTNPDFDPSGDAQNKIRDDQKALAAAQTNLATGQAATDTYLALMPKTLFDLVVGFVQAEATVKKYQAADPNGLLEDLKTKESVYAEALAALRDYERSTAVIAGQLASRQGAFAAAVQVAPARVITALLGAS
jgi:hypothetical protein